MWKLYIILSAIFTALTDVFSKMGVENINSNLATGIRTTVIFILVSAIVFLTCSANDYRALNSRNIALLIVSGIMAGLAFIFYFKALQCGDLSKIAPIDKLSVILTILLGFLIFKEPVTVPVLLGGLLVVSGIGILLYCS